MDGGPGGQTAPQAVATDGRAVTLQPPPQDVVPLRHHLDALLAAVGDIAGRAVVDIGCGTGWLARALGRRGAQAVALDTQWAVLRDTAARHPDFSSVAAAAQCLPFASRAFDGAVLFNSLHHVPATFMARTLVESARIVRRGGWVYVAEPMAEGAFFELIRLVDDETEVRAAAEAALADATSAGLAIQADGRYDHPAHYRSADDLLTRIIGVDPARRAAVAHHEAALRAGFDAAGEAVPDGIRFRHPTRWHLFAI